MNITILNVAIETKPTAKGSYQVADVAYKNNSFQGKVEGKKVMSFGATAEAFKTLAAAQSGDTFEVNVVKNDKGYNDWVSMQKAGQVPAVQNTGVPQAAPSKSFSAPAGRDFETATERAQKQVYIVRQSSLSNAISALAVGAKSALKVDEVLAMAKRYEAYVFSQVKPGGETGFDDIPNLDPSFDNQPQID